jgi:hypothetical protein
MNLVSIFRPYWNRVHRIVVQLVCFALFLLSIPVDLSAQPYYSKYYTRDSGYHYFSSLAAYEDCFYVLSHYNDPAVGSRFGASAILQYDWEGNLLQSDTLPPANGDFYAWPEDLQIVNDSMLFFVAQDTNSLFPVFFNRYFRKFGLTELKPIINKYFYGLAKGLHFSSELFLFPKAHGYRLKKSSSVPWHVKDLVIYKMKDGIVDTSITQEGEFSLIPWCITKSRAGGGYVGGIYTDFDYDDSTDYTFRQFIYEFDTALNLIRKILSPEGLKLGGAFAILEDRQGNMYCAGSDVIWHPNTKYMVGNYFNQLPALSKYNANGEFQWSKRFLDKDQNYDSYYSATFEGDSNHIIAAGEYFLSDTTYWDDTSYSSIRSGVISKMDLQGNYKWNRLYTARGSGRQTSWNQFNDIIRVPQGGYLLCGSSEVAYKQDVNEAGWLMKIDEEGCYIPGCHLISQTADEQNVELQVWPNPARGRVALLHNFDQNVTIKIVDAQGNLHAHYRNIPALDTQLVNLDGFRPGTYYVHLHTASGKPLQVKQLLVL